MRHPGRQHLLPVQYSQAGAAAQGCRDSRAAGEVQWCGAGHGGSGLRRALPRRASVWGCVLLARGWPVYASVHWAGCGICGKVGAHWLHAAMQDGGTERRTRQGPCTCSIAPAWQHFRAPSRPAPACSAITRWHGAGQLAATTPAATAAAAAGRARTAGREEAWETRRGRAWQQQPRTLAAW